MKEKITFTKMDEPNLEQLFEVSAGESLFSRVCAFEPELREGSIVLPVEFTKLDGERFTLGFTLDKQHLRDLLDALDYPEVIL